MKNNIVLLLGKEEELMDNQQKYVLAMYDIRGKQEFIFRTNKIKEIIGGSCIIRDCYKDYLYPAAIIYRERIKTGKPDKYSFKEIRENKEGKLNPAIYTYNTFLEDGKKIEKFSAESFKNRMDEEQFLGEVLYEGGGNFLVLYKNDEVCREINKIFSKEVMRSTYTLQVLCTYITLENGFSNYKADEEELRKLREIHEAQESVIRPVNSLPFVQTALGTSMPLSELDKRGNGEEDEKVSTESFAKLEKCREVLSKYPEEYGEKILDNLVEKKGEESLLAVLFIDGNNMGAQVEACLRDVEAGYEPSVNALRNFSAGIQKNYVDDRKEAIEERLRKKYNDEQNAKHRFIVFAGDEMSFICNARDAFDVQEAYFKELPKGCSACAGIAIFHSHAPYAEAYKIAEECCENGKKKMKKDNETKTCYLDFHYCQGGLGTELEIIRKRETGDMISKPWFVMDNSGNTPDKPVNCTTMEEVCKVAKDLKEIESRTNIKVLVDAAKHSLAAFDMEMSRIFAHQGKEKRESVNYTFKELKGEKRRSLVYDIGIVYDLWFRQNEADNNKMC